MLSYKFKVIHVEGIMLNSFPNIYSNNVHPKINMRCGGGSCTGINNGGKFCNNISTDNRGFISNVINISGYSLVQISYTQYRA